MTTLSRRTFFGRSPSRSPTGYLSRLAGKLMKQNDTDSLSAKIDSLSRDLEVLIKSGVLCENNAISEDDKNVLIAVAQRVVPVLVTLLDSASSPDIKEKTVTALAKISTVDSDKCSNCKRTRKLDIVPFEGGDGPNVEGGDGPNVEGKQPKSKK
nr:vacuolar protein 8 [Ipomoea batatas]